MKKLIKTLLVALPGGRACLTSVRRFRLRRFKNHGEVFSYFYRHNSWDGSESISGPGSTLEYTAPIRAELPGLFESLGIKTFLDAPCGDFNWMRQVDWKSDVHYIGGDVIAELVARNQKNFGDDRRKFIVLDICGEALPEADLWLCRDCLFHLPLADIERALNRFRESKIQYLLTTVHADVGANVDILAGDFRPIDLRLPPFQLCEPQLLIEDWIPGHPVRYLALWERRMVAR